MLVYLIEIFKYKFFPYSISITQQLPAIGKQGFNSKFSVFLSQLRNLWHRRLQKKMYS